MAFLGSLLALPRCSGLAVAPDGSRLVITAARVDAAGTGWARSIWAIDPAGVQQPRRLTASRAGESLARVAPGGDVLFTSARADPDADPDAEDTDRPTALWRLPAAGGEAVLVTAPPGGIHGLEVARDAGTVVLATPMHPRAPDRETDERIDRARRDRRVTAQLYDDFPVRFWDRWLGPRRTRLVALAPTGGTPTDLTPDAGPALDGASFAVAPDGRTVVTTWTVHAGDPRARRTDLVAIDVASGARRTLLRAPATDHVSPAFSPDGRHVVVVREAPSTPEAPGDLTLVTVDPHSEDPEPLELLPGVDRWPSAPVFVDESTVAYLAHDEGRAIVFAVDLSSPGAVRPLTTDGSVSDLAAGGDGRLFALHDAVDRPPRAVALDPGGGDRTPWNGAPRALPTPGADAQVPGRVERVQVPAPDGTPIGGWLVTPGDGRPAPLVVMIHGGPLSSWTGWHWRWNPHAFADEGWAVLLPDPGLSTGYGIGMIRRGWGHWGEEPYTDVLAITEGVAARGDIDATRVAAIGGSFGGYLANWIAGHTDRFSAIVTHAGLWDLRGFHGTTDMGPEWERQMGDPYTDPEAYERYSPHRHLASIRTPMLVIHGTNDFRVPVSEALMLWTGLRRHGVEAHFLHFPDEHHWVEKPGNIRIWYETVTAFLATHLEGRPWAPPPLLVGRDPDGEETAGASA